MPSTEPDEVVRKIEEVEIQGASSIAKAGTELLSEMEREGRSRSEIIDVAQRLKKARPTEPFLFNCVRISLNTGDYERVLRHIDESQDRIEEVGVPLIEDGETVYTHCHSSTVTGLLMAASESKDIKARVTETRPLYQGRETARELTEAGIDVRFYVDSGGRLALKEADKMLIGADAVLSNGKVVNKIGSEMLAEVAERRDVPVYVATNSWKFDPLSSFDYDTKIERRASDEVWEEPPKGVEVVNYAFEHVAPERIEGIVSELGVHEPDKFVEKTEEEYPELLESI